MAPSKSWFRVGSTLNEAPTIANKIITLSRINARSLEITWEKAVDRETPQDKLQYVVSWSPFPYEASAAKRSNPMVDTTLYRITGLLPMTAYEIRIFVFDGRNTVQYYPMKAITTSDPIAKNYASRSWLKKK
ncbi:MAG: fibronectin type III domain-containing protein [Bacteroidales bacterium]|nr:fibronectin type III domain-containing protein [Bacteroidales bacterium]